MDKTIFRSRLHQALKQEYVKRESLKANGWSQERVEWMGTMYADMAVDSFIYDLDVPAIRALVLEYYER